MSHRPGRFLPALVLSLLAGAGCTRWSGCLPQMLVTEQAAGPNVPPGGEITSAQAAQLCLKAGEALEKKGYTAEALQQYEHARRNDPQLPGLARRLAVLYDLQGDAGRAETEYLRAMQEQPRDAELLNDFGYFHFRHHHLQEAENALRNALTMDPGCACAWSNLGQVLAYQGRSDESYQAFAHVLRPAEAYSNVGILLAKQGRTAEARRALEQAIALDATLQQPRAFLNALAGTPSPLPPGITHNAPPAPQPPLQRLLPAGPPPMNLVKRVEVKPAHAPPPPPLPKPAPEHPMHDLSAFAPAIDPTLVPSPRANERKRVQAAPVPDVAPPWMEWTPLNRSQPQPMQWTPPVPQTAVQTTALPSAAPAPLASPPAVAPQLPRIVNGPIRPAPISAGPVPARPVPPTPKVEATTASRHPAPPPPPPPAPLPPPIAPPSTAEAAEGPLLLQTSASAIEPALPPLRLDPAAPRLLPAMPRPKPLGHKPLPEYLLNSTQPQAVLTDCQGEPEAERGSP